MTFRGKVKNGGVVLDGPQVPPEGAAVSVSLRPSPRRARPRKAPATLLDRMRPFIGILDNMPPDFSINHDHYLYGKPKRT